MLGYFSLNKGIKSLSKAFFKLAAAAILTSPVMLVSALSPPKKSNKPAEHVPALTITIAAKIAMSNNFFIVFIVFLLFR